MTASPPKLSSLISLSNYFSSDAGATPSYGTLIATTLNTPYAKLSAGRGLRNRKGSNYCKNYTVFI